MTTLSKEDVISSLQAALEKQSGTAVNIEQSGSWYKIDGGKSVRFSELESMLAEMNSGSKSVTKAATKSTATKPTAKKATATKAKPAVAKKTSSASVKSALAGEGSGLTPKELWRAKLENAKGKNTLPRGF
ncbi:hypothetical protein [Shewanella sp. OMA3-2]|uniref:hypothetical protein n=1 Tax=Shewanella sp. OMA3-2 TaxID=2908650 RepID=UPI001F3BE529|nr:hypothetical protein [Shewanella sp. OMA3-2]UJF20539.1 hypothetical protein L0B17_09955 [Shewanella sp. OMA3-2]